MALEGLRSARSMLDVVSPTCRRISRVPEECCGGAKHVLAISPSSVEPARAAQNGGSLLLRFEAEEQVVRESFPCL
jgi:hypothetical protein